MSVHQKWWNVIRGITDDAPAFESWKRAAEVDLLEEVASKGVAPTADPVWLEPHPVVVLEDFSWHPWDIRYGDPADAEWTHMRLRVQVADA